MKKSSKILGSIALSAALVMGTAAPAFADTPENASDAASMVSELDGAIKSGSYNTQLRNGAAPVVATDGEAAGASTLVQVGTYTSQINVTIPISLPLYFDTAGGPGLAPSKDAYQIANNSTANITVISASYTMKDTSTSPQWKFGEKAYSDGASSPRVTATGPNQSGSMGDVFISLKPSITDTKYKTLDLKSTTGTTATDGSLSDLGWVLYGSNETGIHSLGFEVAASSTQLSKALDKFTPIASITYTVQVGQTQPNDPDANATITDSTNLLSGRSATKAALDGFFIAGETVETVAYVDEDGNPVTPATGKQYEIKSVTYGLSSSAVTNPFNAGDSFMKMHYKVVLGPAVDYVAPTV